jgi:hypothetical protein
MPMMRRRPVMRTVARTAVIAGTATVVAGGVNRHQQQKYADQEAAAQQQAAPPAAPEPAPVAAASDSDDLINKLKELATLKDQGILTEAEFNDQKAKILAQMSSPTYPFRWAPTEMSTSSSDRRRPRHSYGMACDRFGIMWRN